MREGTKNKFAIILGKYKDKSCTEFIKTDTEDISVIGEDITRMINKDILVTNNIDEFININPEREELKKYFNNINANADLKEFYNLGRKNIRISNSYYKTLVCQPYYNVELRKWQIILSFKNTENSNPNKNVEAFFIRLQGFKVSYGQKEVPYNPNNNCYEFSNIKKEKTVISSFTNPKTIPVHNRKKFELTRDKNQLTIFNADYRDDERKLYIVSKMKTRTIDNLFIDNKLFKNYDIFQKTKSITFENVNFSEIIILEFEKHDNYDENNNAFSKLPVKGLRLINYVQFIIK